MSVRYSIAKLIQTDNNHICILCGKTGKIFYWLRITSKTIKLMTTVRHGSGKLHYESYQTIFDNLLELKCITRNCNSVFRTIKDLKIHVDKEHRI